MVRNKNSNAFKGTALIQFAEPVYALFLEVIGLVERGGVFEAEQSNLQEEEDRRRTIYVSCKTRREKGTYYWCLRLLL